jgi:ATP-dependent DNA helicase RecQ
VASFDRPNIQYRIVPKAEPRGSCSTVRAEHPVTPESSTACRGLGREDGRVPVQNGITALPYHAGLDARTRASNQNRFLREDWPHHRGDHRVRHGHRQARRPLRGPSRPAQVGRGLLPGDGTGRPGRPAVDGLARLRAAGRGAAAQAHRRLRGRRRAPPDAGPALDAMLALCESVQCRRVQLLAYFGSRASRAATATPA